MRNVCVRPYTGLVVVIVSLACCAPTAANNPPTRAPISQPTPPATSTNTAPAPTESQVSPANTTFVTPNLSAAVQVVSSSEQIQVGETITITVSVQLNNPEECQYPLYDVSLVVIPNDAALLRFDTPAKIGPPGPNPAIFRLTAVAPGTLQLQGIAYGESNCGNGWQWAYTNGVSQSITIAATSTRFLPYIIAG